MRWCILRTSGARTLALADSLAAAGFEAWTPRATTSRVVRRGRTTAKVERDAPILPTFVFARAHDLAALAAAAIEPVSPHPAFSIFRHAGRIPLVSGLAVIGLQVAERDAALAIEREREADTREEQRRERVAALRTERARRKALRSETRDFLTGAAVVVADAPALVGWTGVVERSDGKSAVVCFGGSLVMTIEAWRLSAVNVDDAHP